MANLVKITTESEFQKYINNSIDYISLERIKSTNSNKIDLGFYYFPNPEPDDTCLALEPSDSILVYGTTFWAKVLYSAKRLVSGIDLVEDLEVSICYYGANMIFTKDAVYIELEDGTKLETEFVPTIFEEDIKIPWIIHSYFSKDAKSTKVPSPQLIYISSEDSIRSLSTYKQTTEHDWDFIQKGLKHGRFHIPNYVQSFIK